MSCSTIFSFSYRIQVLSNSGVATLLVIFVWKLSGSKDKCLDSKESHLLTCLIGGIIGHYSCCNGDTWSSELGILSDAQPRLITTLKVDIYSIYTIWYSPSHYFRWLEKCMPFYICCGYWLLYLMNEARNLSVFLLVSPSATCFQPAFCF